jgi:hypothetical protein
MLTFLRWFGRLFGWERPTAVINDPHDDKISLMTAVRRAYSETQDSPYAKLRKRAASSVGTATSDEMLAWYATEFSQHSTIWGCNEPSNTLEPQDFTDFHFVVQGGEIVAKKPFRDYPLITRLMVSEKELVAFIEDVKAGRI